MRNETRQKFNAYLQQLAQLNGVPDVTQKFTVAPTVQQTLESKMQESSAFLSRVNIVGVRDLEGEKLGLGVSGTIASTTDTTVKDREPIDPAALSSQTYRCEQTNFDTVIRYATIDAWSKFPDFQTRLRDQIVKRAALDRIMIGWHGTSRAVTSDRIKNPLLQDVNIGWLQQIRAHAPDNWLQEVAKDSRKIQIGSAVSGANGFKNLDALVMDMVANLLEPWYQDDTELVVICGRELLHDKYFPLINTTQAPTEMMAADLVLSQKRIGGLPAVRVPFFPANALLVTRLDNLSLYWQEGARRRTVVDNAKRDRIENYESSNDAYVIEDYDCVALAENIVQVEAA
jgi:P2 family phage major capsid protein